MIHTTPREDQILRYAVGGWSDQEIAYELGISMKTVYEYWRRMLERHGCRTRVQFISMYWEAA